MSQHALLINRASSNTCTQQTPKLLIALHQNGRLLGRTDTVVSPCKTCWGQAWVMLGQGEVSTETMVKE